MNGKQAAAIALTLIIAIPILAGYAFASESVTKTQTVTDSTTGLSDILLNSKTAYYNDYNGPENNNLMVMGNVGDAHSFVAPAYVFTGSTETSIPVGSNATASFAVTPGTYTSFSSFAYSSWSFDSVDAVFRLTYADGSIEYVSFIDGDYLKAGSTFVAKDGGLSPTYHYSPVSDVAINPDSATSITLNYYLPGTTYADPSYGWAIPDSTNTYSWINGYANRAVTFYMHLDTPSSGTTTAKFQPYEGINIGGNIDIMLSSAGEMTVKPDYSTTTYTLGTYNDVQIVYDLDAATCTVTGIAAWPPMGGTPTAYNSVSFEIYSGFTTETIPTVLIAGDSSAIWRCDSAKVLAGTFPVTENYTLNMNGLFPGKEYNLKLNSIGIYGDTLTIAGSSYTVTDGNITVNGETVKLKGMEIEVVEDSGTWTTSVNGDQVASGSSAPTFVFGGVWSLTATADILKDVTVTSDEWKPGAFAFDKDNFILMLLLCSVAVFVVLGFTAGRSGGKALALIVTCGGAAVIALMMV